MKDEKARSYKVILKNGDYSILTNHVRIDEDEFIKQLLSGTYRILESPEGKGTLATLDSVASIIQVCSHCQEDLPEGPGDRFCSHCQGRTWVPAAEYSPAQ